MVQDRVGSTDLYLYYQYVREYARDPIDMDDFFDGIASMSARVEIENPVKP